MKIEFRKVVRKKSPFCLDFESLAINGNFKKISNSIVEIEFKIDGYLTHPCDICAEDFELLFDESLKLSISDGDYCGDDMNVLEIYNHFIDFDEIVGSEIEALKSDYHYCDKCKQIKE